MGNPYLAAKRDREMIDKLAAQHAAAGIPVGTSFGYLLAWRPAYRSARPNQAEFFADRASAEARLADLVKESPDVLAALCDSRNGNRKRSEGAGAHGILAACDLLVTSLGNTLCAVLDDMAGNGGTPPSPGVIVRGGFQPKGKRPKSAAKNAAPKKATRRMPGSAPIPIPCPPRSFGGGSGTETPAPAAAASKPTRSHDVRTRCVVVATPEEAAQKQMDLMAEPKKPKSATKVAGQRRTAKKKRAHTAKKADRMPPTAPAAAEHGTRPPSERAAGEVRLMQLAIAGRISGITGMALNGLDGRVTRLLTEDADEDADALSEDERHRLLWTWERYTAWRRAARAHRARHGPPPANQVRWDPARPGHGTRNVADP